MLTTVGMTAGKVHQALRVGGKMSMSRLKKEIGGNDTTTTMAVGWLAREGKIELSKNKNTLTVSLID